MDSNTNFNSDEIEHSEWKETYFKASVGGSNYQILKLSSKDTSQYFILDARGRDCVRIAIQLRNRQSRAYMSQVTYRPTCSIGEHMPRGLYTINMVKALLLKVMQDGDYDRVYLKDKSEIDCVLPGEEDSVFKISLGMLSFILHGKTWYQRHFGAIVMNDSTRQKMMTSNTLLESPMSSEDATKLISSIKEELNYYNTATWKSEVYATVNEIIMSNIGKSWRSVFVELFSDKGMLAKKRELNVGCLLMDALSGSLTEMFNMPNLSNINMYIMRETILGYTESIVIEKDDAPVHVDKKRREMLFKSSMMLNSASMYKIGGKKTIKTRHLHNIPREYGRNVIGYMNRRKRVKGTLKQKKV